MKVIVCQETCIGCGMCVDICPEIFEFNVENKATPKNKDDFEKMGDKIVEAKEICPVEAISVEN